MIRCPAHQITLLNDSTCKARLAWLDKYDNRGRSILNSMAAFNEKSRAEEYEICRRCKGTVPKERKPRPKGIKYKSKWDGKTCSGGADHKKIYAHGMCRMCYNRVYRKGGFEKYKAE